AQRARAAVRAARLIVSFVVRSALFAVIVLAGCTGAPALPLKAWHVSPSGDPRVSTSYAVIPWGLVLRIRPGMTEAEVVALTGQRLQYYHHPVNAIFFSRTPEGISVEIALKRSPSGVIEDLSFKPQ
ncbi:MAG: hypothetical protein ABIT01_00610, partial [Thermoanaerobaculia bacterium]